MSGWADCLYCAEPTATMFQRCALELHLQHKWYQCLVDRQREGECSGNNRFCWWPIHTDGIYEYRFCHAYTATDRHLQYKCGEYSPCCRLWHRLAARLLGQSIQSSGGRCIQLFITRWHTWHTFRYPRGEYSTRHNHPEWHARHLPRRQW